MAKPYTLHEHLAALGYTTKPGNHGERSIHDVTGGEVYRGIADSVWRWLRRTKQVK